MESALSIVCFIVVLIALALGRHYLEYLWWKHKHPSEDITFSEYTMTVSAFEQTEGIYGNALQPFSKENLSRPSILAELKELIEERLPKAESMADISDALTGDIKGPFLKHMVEAFLFFYHDLKSDINKDPVTGRWAFKYMNPLRRERIILMSAINPVYLCAALSADRLEWEENGRQGDWMFSEFTRSILGKEAR